jgi:hypothetical protein
MKLIEFMDLDIDERGPSSRALCLKARRGKNIGISQKIILCIAGFTSQKY